MLILHGVDIFIGLLLFVLGVSYLLRARDWLAVLREMRGKGVTGVLLLALLPLFLGAFIVAFHQSWQGLNAIVTLFGWLQLAKGTTYLLFPKLALKLAERYSNVPEIVVQAAGGGLAIIGAVMIINVFELI